MISAEAVLPMLAQACPSYRPMLDEYVKTFGQDSLYSQAGGLAQHLLDLHEAGLHSEFQAVADLIEHLQVAGDPDVQTLATVGFLEGIQNIWGERAEEFRPFLGPAASKAWQELNAFWGIRSQ